MHPNAKVTTYAAEKNYPDSENSRLAAARVADRLAWPVTVTYTSFKHVPGKEHQIANKKDHKATVDVRDIDVGVANDHGDDGHRDRDIQGHCA
jgi:hypothetical protein